MKNMKNKDFYFPYAKSLQPKVLAKIICQTSILKNEEEESCDKYCKYFKCAEGHCPLAHINISSVEILTKWLNKQYVKNQNISVSSRKISMRIGISCKFTNEQISYIRERYSNPSISLIMIAKEFGCSKSTIYNVVKKITYKNN